MNWLYDHLRSLPRYHSIVVCDLLENRAEFPELTARQFDRNALSRKVWRRLSGRDVHPGVVRILRRENARILHSHFGYVAVDDYDLWRSLKVPWVVGFYGADVYSLGLRQEWLQEYQQVFSACTRVLALGPVMARQIEKLGCPASKILVHPLGVDISTLPECRRPYNKGTPLRVLFAGMYREKKGLLYALQAVAAVREAGCPVELQLVAEASQKPGDQGTKTAALSMIRELGIEDIVVHHPLMAFDDLLRLSLRCHVFLAPSVTAADGDAEGTPFVLQQMMATAMPTISTQHSDIPYLFGDLSHLLVAERDSQAIASRLLSYAEDPERLLEHGGLFRKRMLDHFDVRRCAAELSRVYDAIM
jgi:colanic acid/amylovoran biosynthesis glycosyltransferase